MPHYVPFFEFTEPALALRQFNYEHWCANGHGPNLRDVKETLGFDRREAIQLYKELALGIACTIDPDSMNCPVLRFQPFASFPTQVKAYVDGEFHSYAGCSMEAVAFSNMPPFEGKECRLDSYCMCCMEPISFTAVSGKVVEADPLLLHVSTSPYDWFNNDLMIQCDSMNFVKDEEHAERFEKEVCRRGVVFTLDQALTFVSGAVGERMWTYTKPSERMDPGSVLEGVRGLGVDVTNWGG
ncbi:MAG: organomercurial lyase [Acidimicrobiales bacterium]|nr:organomercurial lyase [Acidimicrobiales bacterium]